MNKKMLFSSVLLACCSGAVAQAQQVGGDFDTYETGWNEVGVQPKGWKGSNVKQGVSIFQAKVQEVFEDQSGRTGSAVKLVNTWAGLMGIGANAPAYITLGSPWVYANVSNINASDGGTFGGVAFNYRPDALHGYIKREIGTTTTNNKAVLNANEVCNIIVYSWKGTTTSVVPNITSSADGISGTDQSVANTDRAILGREEATKSEDFELVAYTNYEIQPTTDADWREVTIPLNYESDAQPEMLNIIISAADYFNRPNIGDNNKLWADDFEFVYYSELASLSYDGQSVDVASAMDLSAQAYDESKLSLTSNGRGATIEKSYDEETALLTITVKGNDWTAENPGNQHVYTVQFAEPVAAATLTDVKVSGMSVDGFDPATTSYTLPYAYNPGIVVEGTPAEGSTLITTPDASGMGVETASYDNEAKTITVKVANSEGKETAYVFNFTDAKAESAVGGTYAGSLAVTLAAEGSNNLTPLENSPITLTENENGTYNLSIYNFTFDGMLVGTIYVPAVTITDGQINARPVIRLTGTNADGTTIENVIGPMLGHLTLDVSAKILDTENKALEASIDILTGESSSPLVAMFKNIHVDFTPLTITASELKENAASQSYYANLTATGRFTKQGAALLQINLNKENPMGYIDLSGATIDSDVTAEDIMAGAPEKNNTLVFLPSSSTLSGTNFVKDGMADNVVLTDSVYFHNPKDFTATALTYNRTLTKQMETIVLPFEVEADELGANIYEAIGVEDNNVAFVTVRGALAANTPAIVFTTAEEAAPIALTNKTIVATPETLSTELAGVTLVGSYAAEEVETESPAAPYDLLNNQFEQVADLASVPFRAYLLAADGSLNSIYGIMIDGQTSVLGTVDTTSAEKVDVYSLSGTLLRRGVAPAKALDGLAKGVYVVGGRKVMK